MLRDGFLLQSPVDFRAGVWKSRFVYLSIYLSFCLSICLSDVCIFTICVSLVCLSIYLCLFFSGAGGKVALSGYLSMYLSVCVCVYMKSRLVCLSAYLFIYPFVWIFTVCVHVLSIFRSICVNGYKKSSHVCLSIYLCLQLDTYFVQIYLSIQHSHVEVIVKCSCISFIMLFFSCLFFSFFLLFFLFLSLN